MDNWDTERGYKDVETESFWRIMQIFMQKNGICPHLWLKELFCGRIYGENSRDGSSDGENRKRSVPEED